MIPPRKDSTDRLVALDIATETGWCIGAPQEEPTWGAHRIPGEDLAHKLMSLDRWLSGLLIEARKRGSGVRELRVIFEQPPSLMWAGGKTNATTLVMLQTYAKKVEEVCARLKIRANEVPAAKWKKALCGTARIGKAKPYPVTEALAQRGWTVPNHNAADAVGLWLYTVGYLAQCAAARFDPLARRLAAKGKCYVSSGWCATHGRAASECRGVGGREA